ncbi:response regulator transcription factor [Nonomuraea sp. SBT364]|uniref:response regulator transcription factor n=1 Tax=Nonomuraea sp. SBT364 TaxID=1580530 RepID=UPI00066BD642|nr:response regulator transcription factor [Nonomuraea sp. SBT364]
MIKVLLADDQTLLRRALAALLRLERDLEVVGEAGDGDEALAGAAQLRPDVVLLDIQMPGRDGLTTIAGLTALGCRVIMLTTFGRPGYLSRAMESGAAGFVVKDISPEGLVETIRKVHAGLRVVDPVLAAESLAGGASPLTCREREILLAAADGGTVTDLARQFCLTEGTVRNHLSAAIGKTGARTRAEAVRIADQRGWL